MRRSDALRSASITQSTYRQLREMILSRELMPGSPLQEKKLAERLGVSRTPIREALSRLTTEGLVSQARGATPSVRKLSTGEFIEILYIRRLLEMEAATRAAESDDTDDLLRIRERLVAFLDGTRPGPDEHWEIDDRLHVAVARMAGSDLLRKMIEELRAKTHIFDMGQIPERFESGIHEHLEIIEAILAKDAERARRAMRVHINNAKDSIVRALESRFRYD